MTFSVIKLNKEQSKLISAVRKINDERELAGLTDFYPEDIEAWNHVGVKNLIDLERYILLERLFKLNQSVYQIIPIFNNYQHLSNEEITNEIKKLLAMKRCS